MKMFKIIIHEDKDGFEDEVSRYILQGWFPYGPVQIGSYVDGRGYTRKQHTVTVMRMKPPRQAEEKPTTH